MFSAQDRDKTAMTLRLDKLLPDGTSLCKFTSDKEKVCDAFDHLDKNSFIQCKLVLK